MTLKNISVLEWEIFKDLPLHIGITTRNGGFSKAPYSTFNLAIHSGDNPDSVYKNRNLLTKYLECSPNSYTHGIQVHGDIIHIVDEKNISKNNIECDALITTNFNALLNIYVADCVPIAIYDPVKKVGALCHCGWRGTNLDLLQKTIKKMVHSYKSMKEDILIGIGPSIGSCCYNVSEDLYSQFNPKENEGHKTNNKFYLDLKVINKNRAIVSGVLEKNIEIMDYCTSCNNDLFYSYRKEGESSGRFSCYLKLIP